jgi:hypothetical protein
MGWSFELGGDSPSGRYSGKAQQAILDIIDTLTNLIGDPDRPCLKCAQTVSLYDDEWKGGEGKNYSAGSYHDIKGFYQWLESQDLVICPSERACVSKALSRAAAAGPRL